jgi:hypothetical protein
MYRAAVIHVIQFNIIFVAMYGVAIFFADTDIPFLHWIYLCNTVFFIVILPYLMYMRSRNQ